LASRRGGEARTTQLAGSSADPLTPLEVADLDLETVAGLKTYLARALLKLGQMPFDVRVANSIGQLVQTQRGLLEASDLEGRVATLEAKLTGGLRAA
jgi:hypothetical protein